MACSPVERVLPKPVFMRVMQTLPGPMPTLVASAPQFSRSITASGVPTLPAITNEAGLQGGEIGAIQIADGFSLVEVPDAAADRVIQALRGATIRGQKVMIRRERY